MRTVSEVAELTGVTVRALHHYDELGLLCPSEYGQAEWDAIRREGAEIVDELVALMRAGEPATGAAARALAERHREHLSRWFYPCSPQMHRGLAEMYVADERFRRNYEHEAEGLAT
jgi:hypothetical protein